MATSCGIALRAGETFTTIYCHNDGYPDYMLPMLQNNYNSLELAAKLVSYGDASYIDKKLEPTSDFHKFGTPEPNVCMFYHRDRGEDWHHTMPTCYTKNELFKQSAFEYIYIFEDGRWNVYYN
jgi:hypothetical protein